MPKILINVDLGEKNFLELRERHPQYEIHMLREPPAALLAEAEILVGRLNADILEKAANLKWFHTVSSGIDHFIGQVERLRGDLVVTNGAGAYGVPIAERLLALMLALSNRIHLCVRNMREHKWGGVPASVELAGSTVGIAGFGDIGVRLAELLVPFRCEVLAFKRAPCEKPANVAEMLYGGEGLDELLRRSDHVCLCLPGTPQTRGLVDRRRLGLMKRTACIYNIGRGYTLDTDALVDALLSGAIAGAGLDVTDPEPLPPGHRLWDVPNAVITPHTAGLTQPNWGKRVMEVFERNLEAYAAGLPLPGAVDRANRY
jgi:phosphoglycerate dehydrogenase-like enzyme